MDHISTVFYQTKEILASLASGVFFKTCITALLTTGMFLLGEENYEMLVALSILVIFDLLTGMIASVSTGSSIESRKVLKTATKSFVYLIFFSSAHLTYLIIPFSGFIETGVLSFLAITELLSIVENMARMGYILPAKLLNQIEEVYDVRKKDKCIGNTKK